MQARTRHILAAGAAFLAADLFLGGPITATSCQAQSLEERINHVMRERANQQNRGSAARSKGGLLGTLLYTDLSVSFNETPARDAFEYLRTVLGINIVGRYLDDRTGIGIDPDTPINLEAEDQNALTILEMILDQCSDGIDECTWQLRSGTVEVGTKERLGSRRAQEIRYYPIRDLLYEPPHYDNAPSLDLDTALSQGGNSGGGGGGGRGGGGGGGGRGGGGGGGGGGTGSLFGDAGDDPETLTELERAQSIVDLITEIVEPEGWEENGGEWGTIRYHQGTLIIRAPDFMHRQIGGYPAIIRPTRGSANASPRDRRYVTFSGSLSQVEIIGIKQQPVQGAVGGGTP